MNINWRFITALVLMQILSTVAHADKAIYRCKDSSGKIVYQQYNCNEDQIVAGVDVLKTWRDLRALSSKGKVTLSLLTGDKENIKACESEMESFNQQLESMRVRVDAFSDQQELQEAYSFLIACGECRSSAMSNCMMADHFLQRATQSLSKVAN